MYLEPDFFLSCAPEVAIYRHVSGLGDGALVPLLRLWSMAEKFWPNGDMGTDDPVTVAAFAGFMAPWENDGVEAKRFCAALVSAGLATLDKTYCLVFRAGWGWLVRFGSPPREYGATWPKARAAALERDGYGCVECNARDGLEVHHVKPIRSFAHPDAANTLENLKTLCGECHLREENDRRRAR